MENSYNSIDEYTLPSIMNNKCITMTTNDIVSIFSYEVDSSLWQG